MILKLVLTYFKEKKTSCNYDIFMGESTVLNKFIVMDGVLSLAGKSNSKLFDCF